MLNDRKRFFFNSKVRNKEKERERKNIHTTTVSEKIIVVKICLFKITLFTGYF